ncbi:trehalose-phosphatase [Salinarimonas sp.]|uniref:trehalose-phosphatase n=1 Tax=Salinarimonas sp. TaxID=2766526 RepID=UPI0032D8BA88
MTMIAGADEEAIAAAIFDMDGVVTDSAEAHFAAWKETFDEVVREHAFGEAARPFTRADYREHVDGVPRFDGVRRFLASRGIALPEGEPGEERLDSVQGVGTAKNRRFQRWLEEKPVPTYEDTIAFIHALKRRGIRVGIFSASRNAVRVLDSAGVRDLFDAKVDGIDAREADLPGKPEPDVLIACARRLGAEPARTMVFEDAVSGVQAGAKGRFRLVVGVNREDERADSHGVDLRAHGADLVTRDLRRLLADDGLSLRATDTLPDPLEERDAFARRLGDRPLAVFLDYDGTLTPIVEDFTAAGLSPEMEATLERLGRATKVAVISGRDLEDVQNRVRLPEIYYAGSHGFDIAGPASLRARPGEAERFLPALDAAEGALRDRLADIAGARIERKTFSIAVHWRGAAEADVARIEDHVDSVVEAHETLRKSRGKKVFQIQPRTDWDKGRAVRWLLDHTPMGEGEPCPLYVGDDLTDEDAFAALDADGIGIVVRDGARATAADYAIDDPDAVRRFLDMLAERAEGRPP